MAGYPSELSAADQERIRQWHESAYQQATAEAAGGEQTFAYLGRSIVSANAPMIDAARLRADADAAVESGLDDFVGLERLLTTTAVGPDQ